MARWGVDPGVIYSYLVFVVYRYYSVVGSVLHYSLILSYHENHSYHLAYPYVYVAVRYWSLFPFATAPRLPPPCLPGLALA